MEINKTLTKIHETTWLGSSDQCYQVMYTVARTFQVKSVLEIGTHQGASAITFCQAILDNNYIPELTTVDSWIGVPNQPDTEEQKLAMKNRALNFFKEAKFDKYIEMIEGDSKVVLSGIFQKIGKVDLCFIDGNHEYDYVISDFENCKNFTDIILLHDTAKGNLKYPDYIKNQGWTVITFPTRYLEGQGQLIGISLAIKP